jgi:hypothetical protein
LTHRPSTPTVGQSLPILMASPHGGARKTLTVAWRCCRRDRPRWATSAYEWATSAYEWATSAYEWATSAYEWASPYV